jgi:2-polyprenyl-3-methyl-5-hydroxy-6-metoxy-1,4-benzoquinol methylase
MGLRTGERIELQSDQKRWDKKYKDKESVLGPETNPFLRRHIRLLPKGKALDIATGEGKNAVFLAQQGFDVEAVDISKFGLGKAQKLAKESGVKIRTLHAELDHYQVEEGRYDLITDFYFLDRRLIPGIKRGLKKGGRVVFETYLMEQMSLSNEGLKNPRYLLKSNELLNLFRGFRILFYREGIFREGGARKAIASLIAEKI